ncbi:MAG: 6-phosphofructokinase, partial [Desulfobacterales bacterium]|nr:6-phosphofructokinase [Desulfobacterales bacterium]
MSGKNGITAEELLKIPEVQEVTGSVSRELVQRRRSQSAVCDVFNHPFTALKTDNRYRFEIDREARKQLPDIIGNAVQTLVGLDAADEAFAQTYCRQRNIGIVFSGGPAPGGHNVIAGLWDAAKKANPDTKIFGFILGPDGIIENEAVELTAAHVDAYRNLGGFTMIKTGRTKIDTAQKMALSRETCKALALDALVIVGGDDSNTNAAFLAQELLKDGVQVMGVPKTIDGDIQVRDADGHVLCAMSFGFHSAARAFAHAVS